MQTPIYNRFHLNFKSQPLLNKTISKDRKVYGVNCYLIDKFIYSRIKAIKKKQTKLTTSLVSFDNKKNLNKLINKI